MTTRLPLLISQLALIATTMGCTAISDFSPTTTYRMQSTMQQPVRRVSFDSMSSGIRIVSPRDLVRIRSGDKRKYICDTGRPLVCEYVGATAYCSCPRML